MFLRPDRPALEPNEQYLGRRTQPELTQMLEKQLASCLLEPGAASLWPDNDNLRSADITLCGADGRYVVVEAKNVRRRFTLDHEREAFKEQYQSYLARTYISGDRVYSLMHELAHTALDDHQQVSERLDGQPCLIPVSDPRDNSLISLPTGSGKSATMLAVLSKMVLRDRVVVSRRESNDSAGKDLRRKVLPGQLFVQVAVSDAEALLLRSYRSAALKRLGMVLRALFASLHGLIHAATRSLAPPGRLVTASPHPTRGPNSLRMTANPVIRGMSFAYA